jgi:hypothetical protein
VEVPALPFDRALWQAPQRRARAAAGQPGSLSVYGRMELSEMEGFVGPGAVEGFMKYTSGNKGLRDPNTS